MRTYKRGMQWGASHPVSPLFTNPPTFAPLSVYNPFIMSLFAPPAPPATKLGHLRKLAPSAGVHVSPICLGAMSIGDQWEKFGMGSMDKESSFKLLDAFYDAGGNFIDTANS